MSMPPDTRITDIAHDLLTNLASGLESAGIDVPDRRYVHSGQIAHDFVENECSEAFIVSWLGILQSRGQSTVIPGTPVKCAVPLNAAFTIALLRCVPTLSGDNRDIAPSEADLEESGTAILTDAMTLPKVAINTHLAGTLLPSSKSCKLVGIGDVTPIGPLGGIGGCTMTLYVSLV